jgi:hypothetical protein
VDPYLCVTGAPGKQYAAQLTTVLEPTLLLCYIDQSCYSLAHLGWLTCWHQQPRRMQSLQHTTKHNRGLPQSTRMGVDSTGTSWDQFNKVCDTVIRQSKIDFLKIFSKFSSKALLKRILLKLKVFFICYVQHCIVLACCVKSFKHKPW